DLSFDIQFLNKLREKVKIVINYYDTEYYYEGVDAYYAQTAHLVMLPDALARYRYLHLGIPAITTFALYDKSAYRKIEGQAKDIDVSFIGNVRLADRKEWLDYLKANDIKVQSYGVGSDNGFVSFKEMISIFNRSKINLNFTSTTDVGNYTIKPPTLNNRIRQSKGRPIEIAMCGGFILSQYAPGIEEMFDLGEEFDVFQTKEELLAKIRHYLEEDDKREAMAVEAHTKALARYDVISGFARVFKTLNTQVEPPALPLYLDKAFKENYASFRAFYVAIFLLTGRFACLIEEIRLILKAGSFSFSKGYYFFGRGTLLVLQDYPRLGEFLKKIKKKAGLKVKY
ncbi:MAG: glycosyltransferase, partial [Alphaproteobacteria bacterium]|nr:glycosyltransferase [Alphaproteobacteria bacterium]